MKNKLPVINSIQESYRKQSANYIANYYIRQQLNILSPDPAMTF